MAKTKDFARYVTACDYPGTLNEAVVEASLREYLAALGLTRAVRRLRVDWDLATEEPLRRTITRILDDFASRMGARTRSTPRWRSRWASTRSRSSALTLHRASDR